MSHLYWYQITPTKLAYDADSIHDVTIDYGFQMERHGIDLRLWGINTPEVKGHERPQGLEARDFLRTLIKPGERYPIYTHRDKTGKYGRLLVELFAPINGVLTNVNEHLVDVGHAVVETYGDPFDGFQQIEQEA